MIIGPKTKVLLMKLTYNSNTSINIQTVCSNNKVDIILYFFLRKIYIFYVLKPVLYKRTNDQTKLKEVKIESLYEPRANTIMFPFGVT